MYLLHAINPKWMGFGDVRYAFFLGWSVGLFGAEGVAVMAGLAVLSGGCVAIVAVAMGRARFGQALPFGPFMSLGAIAAVLYGAELFAWYLRLLGVGALAG